MVKDKFVELLTYFIINGEMLCSRHCARHKGVRGKQGEHTLLPCANAACLGEQSGNQNIKKIIFIYDCSSSKGGKKHIKPENRIKNAE